jgi:aspartate aminotransferase
LSEIKKTQGLPTIDTDAEKITMENILSNSKKLGIDESFARQFGELIVEQTIHVQELQRPEQSKDQLLKGIVELSLKLTSEGKKITRFESGPNFVPPESVIRNLTSTFRKRNIVGYGSAAGLLELRKALAEDLSEEHNTPIDPDQILITPGSRFAIFATIMTFVSGLERVIIPQPAWPAYEECVGLTKGRTIPLDTAIEDDWDLNLSKLEDEMRKGARMLVLNSPSNPTGKVIDKHRFHEIVDLARKYGILVLSDEVYEKFVHSKAPSILEEDYDDYVYINSFSKQFSLAGLRIAYLVTTKERVKRIRRIVETAVTCVPEFVQRAALVALKKGKSHARRNIDHILEKVDLTCKELTKIDVDFYRPDGAVYVFPRARKMNFDSAKFATELLMHKQISISPGQSFGHYPAFFRLAVSLPERQIPNAIHSIGKAIEDWSQ